MGQQTAWDHVSNVGKPVPVADAVKTNTNGFLKRRLGDRITGF